MLTNTMFGTPMMVLTTGVHSVCTVVSFLMLKSWLHRRHTLHSLIPLALISATILMFFAASMIEVSMWAYACLFLGSVEGVETSLYYSMVTFTTLGYGDIVLDQRGRHLASLQAADAIIMFGWTAAMVMAVAQRTFVTLLEHIHGIKDSSACKKWMARRPSVMCADAARPPYGVYQIGAV